MNRQQPWRLAAIPVFFLLATRCSLLAAFKDSGWGTRPAGLGGAYTAISDDAEGAFYNPAGLGRLEERVATFMYAKPYLGLDLNAGVDGTTSLGMNYLTAAAPAGRFGTIGLSWADFNVSGLYREDTYALTYARGLHDLLWPGRRPRLYAGVNVKSLSHAYTLDDQTRQSEATSTLSPFRDGTSASAMGVDTGLQFLPTETFAVGVAGKNLNSPDVGLRQKDPVAREVRLGAAWMPGDVGVFEDLTPTFEISYRKPQGNDADLRTHFGVESWFYYHSYALRLGGNDRELAFGGAWSRAFSRFALQMDYAFVWSTTLENNSGTHRLSLTLRQASPAARPAGPPAQKADAAPAAVPIVVPAAVPIVMPAAALPAASPREAPRDQPPAAGLSETERWLKGGVPAEAAPEPAAGPLPASSGPAPTEETETEYRPSRHAGGPGGASEQKPLLRSRPRR